MSEATFELFGQTFRETGWTGWAILLGGIFGGLLAGRITRAALTSIGRRMKERGWPARAIVFDACARPAGLTLFTVGLALGLEGPTMAPLADSVAIRLIALLYILCFGWLVFNLIGLIDHGLRSLTAKTSSKLDDQLVPLVRKTLRISIVVVMTLFAAENVFGADISAWLTGLGIAGLAISLASQDSVKNLFGSITVLFDRPFAVGDRIAFSGVDGVVEEIGFRSTKIRTQSGHLVTVPNMKFIDGVVENISSRPSIRRTFNLGINCRTSPAKVEEAITLVRGILAAPECAQAFSTTAPPRVFFNQFNPDNFGIEVTYWFVLDAAAGKDSHAYNAHAEDLNLKILRAFKDAGIEIAPPTRGVFISSAA